MKDTTARTRPLGSSALFALLEIVNDRDEVVWSRMIRLSTYDADRLRAAQLSDATISTEKAYEELPIFD